MSRGIELACVIEGPVDLEGIRIALQKAYPGSKVKTYFSKSGSREIEFENENIRLAGHNPSDTARADSTLGTIGNLSHRGHCQWRFVWPEKDEIIGQE